jgi:hypothetical protein
MSILKHVSVTLAALMIAGAASAQTSDVTMTNANVDTIVESASGRELTLSYRGGSEIVTVPKNVPVVAFAPATRVDLTAGKTVFVLVTPTPQGELEAHVLFVEKDGVVPAL